MGTEAVLARYSHTRSGSLPTRTCQSCGLAFSWRKKWERDWEQVKYCSDRCRRNRDTGAQRQAGSVESESFKIVKGRKR
ncbi:MAG: DUF2256 domain-containing protein [Planctomycetota bacterium]